MNTKTKVAFVTGANRGIGFETAKALAERDIHVIIGARDGKAGKAAAEKLKQKGLLADSITFDVNRIQDHHAAVNYFAVKFGRLDILVNNAGVLLEKGNAFTNNASTVDKDILQTTFETNFFSVVALTQALLPLIRKAPEGRIVNLSSILGSLSLHTDEASPIYSSKLLAYNASKTALNAFTIHLAHELKDTNIKVNSAHPGWVKTELGGPNAPLDIPDGAKTSVQLALLPTHGPTGGHFHLGDRLPW